jgi:hypothetical protein
MSELINNQQHRIATLAGIIRDLHAGRPAAEVKARLRELVGQCDAGEIAAMEQELIAQGMPVAEIMGMCDLHREVVADLVAPVVQLVPPGHPIDVLQQENAALKKRGEETLPLLAAADPWPSDDRLVALRRCLNDLMDVEKHYQRKEHAWFSILERHGVDGPSKVMWGKDDEVRQALAAFDRALNPRSDWPAVAAAGRQAVDLLLKMVEREDTILVPMCQSLFTEEDWGQIHADSPQYGWCLVEPRARWQPPQPAAGPQAAAMPAAAGIDLGTGVLTIDQLRSLFATLPVDLTFVDHEDRVRFFSEGPNRIFTRTPVILGRKVQHCHPPKSVDTVERILADFRAGTQSTAEFWITFQDRFVHIRYFAVRKDGQYRGCLEVTQDVTGIRKLEGERRLLSYG